VLDKNSLLHLPAYRPQHVIAYQDFTTFLHKHFQRPAPGEDNDDNNDGNSNDDEGNSNDDDEFKHLSQPSADKSTVFCRWLRLLASYMESSSIVSHHSESATSLLKIQFVAVKPPNYSPDVCAAGNWKNALKSVIMKHQPTLKGKKPIKWQDVITFLDNHLATNEDLINPVYRDFLDVIPRWTGTIHCEAALASLILFAILKLEGHEDVKNLMQVNPFTFLLISPFTFSLIMIA